MATVKAIGFTALMAVACGGRTAAAPEPAISEKGLPPGTVHRRDLACGCAIKADRSVWCWGADFMMHYYFGLEPAPLADLGTNVAYISDGGLAAIKEDGSLWSAAADESTEGEATGQRVPATEVAAFGKTVIAIGSALPHAVVAQTVDGSLWSWHADYPGEPIPDPNPGLDPIAALGHEVVFAAGPIFDLPSLLDRTICAVKLDGTVWCWGADPSDLLGVAPQCRNSNAVSDCILPIPEVIAGLPNAVIRVGLSEDDWVICALTRDGEVWCWGTANAGRLGGAPATEQNCHIVDNYRFPCRRTPGKVPSLGNEVAAMSVGAAHSCALKKDSSVWCWGEAVGTPNSDFFDSPTQVTALGNEVADVVACDGFTCARKTDGALWCWGRNDHGQLGDGTTTDSAIPVKVLGDWP